MNYGTRRTRSRSRACSRNGAASYSARIPRPAHRSIVRDRFFSSPRINFRHFGGGDNGGVGTVATNVEREQFEWPRVADPFSARFVPELKLGARDYACSRIPKLSRSRTWSGPLSSPRVAKLRTRRRRRRRTAAVRHATRWRLLKTLECACFLPTGRNCRCLDQHADSRAESK